jgi:outer membrane protein assembly factor BamB
VPRLATTVTAAALLLLAPATASAGETVTYQGGSAHDGHVDESLAAPLAVAWEVRLPPSVSYPLVTGGRVFVTTSSPSGGGYGSTLHAIDAANGGVLWTQSLPDTYYRAGLAAGDGRVVTLGFDGDLRAFAADSGEPLWSKAVDYFAATPPVIVDGLVIVAKSGSVAAFDAETGDPRWTGTVNDGGVQGSPAVADGRVFASGSSETAAFDLVTGLPRWTASTPDGEGWTAAVRDGGVYVRSYGADGGTVLATSDGAKLGSFGSLRLPAFASGIGVFSPGESLVGRELSSGETRWTGPASAMAPFIAGDSVFGAAEGEVFALDLQSGARTWSCALGTSVAPTDEHNYSGQLTGFGVGDGLLVVPAEGKLVGFRSASVSRCPASGEPPLDEGGGQPPPEGEPPPGGGSGGPEAIPLERYVGGRAPGRRTPGLVVTLVRNGSQVRARVGFSLDCRRTSYPFVVSRPVGSTDGTTFTAAARTRVDRGLRARVTIRGSFTADGVTATSRLRVVRRRGGTRGCRGGRSGRLRLRREPAPAGQPAGSAPNGSVLLGSSDQRSAGLPLGAALRVVDRGRRIVASWQALARCPRGPLPIDNHSPPMRITRNGTFRRRERFTIRYRDGSRDRYRVSFAGQLLTDGAVGTLRVRVSLVTRRGRTLARCDSGVRRWAAAP